MAAFPLQPEQLTNEWFTRILRTAGKLGTENSVTAFDVSFIGDGVGLLGMVVRVRLTYASAVSAGPSTVVISLKVTDQDPATLPCAHGRSPRPETAATSASPFSNPTETQLGSPAPSRPAAPRTSGCRPGFGAPVTTGLS